MATLYDTLKAFKATLDGATDVPTDDIVLNDQEKAESTPAIVFEPFPSKVTFNDIGQAPSRIVRNGAGNVVDYEYDEFVEIQFDVTVIADSVGEMLPIYEAVREAFRPYEEWESPHNFHSDCESITVEDSTPDNVRDMRGQTISVYTLFTRVTSRWGDSDEELILIESIDVDLHDDGEN